MVRFGQTGARAITRGLRGFKRRALPARQEASMNEMTNGFDSAEVRSYLNQIAELEADYRDETTIFHQRVRAIEREAWSAAKIPPRSFKMLRRRRALETKIAALEPTDRQALRHLEAALAGLEDTKEIEAPKVVTPTPPLPAPPVIRSVSAARPQPQPR